MLVELEADESQLAAIIARLIGEKVPIRNLDDKQPALEDVFMMVTKRLVG